MSVKSQKLSKRLWKREDKQMAGRLKYYVDIQSPTAVYVQIEDQIRFTIASGRAKGGDTLPSVRVMSSMLDVNPNTVTKAYRDMELLGLVRTRRGVGVTVTDQAVKICKIETRKMVKANLTNAVAQCTASGLNASEIRKVVTGALENGAIPYAPTAKK